jgi:hypothetical protein
MKLVSAALGLVSSASLATQSAPTTNALEAARTFLEAFAAEPTAARQYVTRDAMVVMGDIGGPFNDYVTIIRSEAPDLLTGCRIGQLQEKPGPTAAELKDGPPRYQGGKLTVFDGNYDCAQNKSRVSDFKFIVILKDDRVVELHLGNAPR